MKASRLVVRAALIVTSLAGLMSISPAAEINPAAVTFKLPDQIKWSPADNRGVQAATLLGDPDKPGFYVVLTKWLKGNHFSRPHFHPNDRYIQVLSGTWWVGTGPKFDPDNLTVPMPAGSFVTHFAKQVHWDGAKDEDAVLLIMGEGPATATGAEQK
jgi:quercetin dioxygenase-like cupin family protein